MDQFPTVPRSPAIGQPHSGQAKVFAADLGMRRSSGGVWTGLGIRRSNLTKLVPVLGAVALVIGSGVGVLAHAQEVPETTRGVVVDAMTQEPLSGVLVAVAGTEIRTITDPRGRFTFERLAGMGITFEVSRVGYRRHSESVSVGDQNIRIALRQTAIDLDAVVVTGTAGGTQARAVGNPVTRVNMPDILETTVAGGGVVQLLSSRVPGLSSIGPAGNVGTASTIRIRGISSLTLSSGPLIYVDGVRIDNDQFAGPNIRWGRVNRLNDINPEDIESIEVVKGPAAATLYGTEASSGVIQIITKSGAANATRYDLTVRQGAAWHVNPAKRWPTNYDRDPDTGELREFNLIAEEIAAGRSPFRTGHQQGYALSMQDGSAAFRYHLSGQFDRNEGIVEWNWQNRRSVQARLDVTPNESLSLTAGLSVLQTDARFASASGLGSAHLPASIIWTPPARRTALGRGYFYAPPEAIAEVEAIEDFDRFIGRLTITHRPLDWLRHRLTVGRDIGNARNSITFPRHPTGSSHFFGVHSLGRKELQSRRVILSTVDYVATSVLNLNSNLSSETSFGAQYHPKATEISGALGLEFPVPGRSTVTAAARTTASEDFIENKTLGVFVQEQIGWNDRAFLTAALRADDNSAFGRDFSFVFYPKLAATWVPYEEGHRGFGAVNAVKLRAAWGRAGQQPDVFAAERLYNPIPAHRDDPGLTPAAVGNPNLKPEVGEELELGFDAALFDDRATVSFTYYNQRTRDAIVQSPVAQSTGFPGVRFENIGEFLNRGIELVVDGVLIDQPSFNLSLGLNLSTNHNEILSLGEFDEITLSATQKHKVGYPVAGLWAPRVLSAEFDEDGQVVNALCEAADGGTVPCTADAPGVFRGAVRPRWHGGMQMTTRFLQNWRLHALVDFTGGHKMISGDLAAGHSAFGVSRAAVERTDPVLAAYNEIIGFWQNVGVKDAGFAKLRDVALTYTIPSWLVDRFGASRGSIGVAAQNVATVWQAQKQLFGRSDVDAEYASPDDFSAYHQTSLPNPTSFMVTLRLTF